MCVCARAPYFLRLTNLESNRFNPQITGLEPGSAFLFKSALYPCVIEFTVKRDRDTNSAAAAKAAAVGTAVRTLSSDSAAGAEGEGGGGVDALGKDGNAATAAAAAAAGEVGAGGGDGASGTVEGETSSSSSSSWLGQAKPKETSYKVGLEWFTGQSLASWQMGRDPRAFVLLVWGLEYRNSENSQSYGCRPL